MHVRPGEYTIPKPAFTPNEGYYFMTWLPLVGGIPLDNAQPGDVISLTDDTVLAAAYSTEPTYQVKIDENITNGRVVLMNPPYYKLYKQHDMVELFFEPEADCKLVSIYTKTESGVQDTVVIEGGDYAWFNMPDENVTVYANFAPIVHVDSVSLDTDDMTLQVLEKRKLTATVEPDNAVDKGLIWSSEDESVAQVDQQGNVTGVKEGETTITVKTKDGDKTATCTVTVVYDETQHIHHLREVPRTEPTCTEAGNKLYYICDQGDHPCGNIFEQADGSQMTTIDKVTLPATGHDWGNWTVETPATVFNDGSETRTCANDVAHNHIQTRPIPAVKDSLDIYEVKAQGAVGNNITATAKVLKPGEPDSAVTDWDITKENARATMKFDNASVTATLLNAEEIYGSKTLEGSADGTTHSISMQLATKAKPVRTIAPKVTKDIEVITPKLSLESTCFKDGKATITVSGDQGQKIKYLEDPGRAITGADISGATEITGTTITVSKAGKYYVFTEPSQNGDIFYTRSFLSLSDGAVPDSIEVKGHDFGEWMVTKAPTCSEAGAETCKCSVCGTEETREIAIDPDAHEWKFVDFTWTGDETDGYTAAAANYVCNHDSSHTESVNAEIAEAVIAPTCTEGGKTTYTATVSAAASLDKTEQSESKDAKKTEALDHDWGEATYEWSADNSKVTATRKCKHDESHVESEEVSTKQEIITPATCTEEGKVNYTAEFENEAFETQTKKDQIVPALGHKWDAGKVTKPATETADGVKTYTCTVCGETKTETIPAKGYAPGTDPNQKGEDGTPAGKGASAAAVEKAIMNAATDEGPAGTKYAPLMLKSTKQAKKSVTIKWTKVSGAKKYVIYGTLCGKANKMKKIGTSTGKTKTVKKIAGKALKKGKYYKFIVVALDKNNKVVSTSKVVHAATKGGKVGNHKSVTVKKAVVNKAKKLKKGKTLKLRAKAVKVKLKVKNHRKVSYESTNPAIATVSKAGVVKGKKKGTCYVYAYAQNGVSKRIKVVVK